MNPVNARAFRKCARILIMRAHVMTATNWPLPWPGGWTKSTSREAPLRGILQHFHWRKTPHRGDRSTLMCSECPGQAGRSTSTCSGQPRPGISSTLESSECLVAVSCVKPAGAERRDEAPESTLTCPKRLRQACPSTSTCSRQPGRATSSTLTSSRLPRRAPPDTMHVHETPR